MARLRLSQLWAGLAPEAVEARVAREAGFQGALLRLGFETTREGTLLKVGEVRTSKAESVRRTLESLCGALEGEGVLEGYDVYFELPPEPVWPGARSAARLNRSYD